jgi:hypothetical protein
MDGKQFDSLTKTLATGTSRRSFLRGLAAAVAGTVLATRRQAEAEAIGFLTLMCFPTVQQGYTLQLVRGPLGIPILRLVPRTGSGWIPRLVPRALVPYYLSQGAKLAGPGGSCLSCPPAYTPCGGVCVDLRTDDAHCGTCERACGTDQTCTNGECLCDFQCCTEEDCTSWANETCVQGVCVCEANTCASLQVACGRWNDGCGRDDLDCGACGVREFCNEGSCKCEAGTAPCGIGDACLLDDGGTCTSNTECCSGACVAGICIQPGESCDDPVDCTEGNTCCDGSCTDTSTNPQHCGSCGYACASTTEICSNGECLCAAGYEVCGDACKLSNGQSCGANAACCSGACVGNVCVSAGATCDDPGDCLGGDSCCGSVCTDTTTDPQNCGGCGIICDLTQTCIDGMCQSPQSPQPTLFISGGTSGDGVISGTGFTPGATIVELYVVYQVGGDPIDDRDYSSQASGVDSSGQFATSSDILFCLDPAVNAVSIFATDSGDAWAEETFEVDCG